jgi:hypothetical protein
MTLTQPANTSPDLAGSGIAGSPFNLIDVAQGYVFDPILLGAVSRKTHGSAGTFDIDLPLGGGPAGVECRSGGTNNDYTIIVTFRNSLNGVANATVAQGTGTVNSNSGIGPGANQYTINLTGVTNAQHLGVTLLGVQDVLGNVSSSVTIPMDVLLGDVNGNGIVSNGDVSLVQAQVAQPVTSSNFRDDVNANGIISNGDVSVTKAQVGQTLP